MGALFGVDELDLGFSGFRAQLAHSGAGTLPLSPGALVAVQLAQIPFEAILPNGLLTFGEELGWRDYLLPLLLPLGRWPALLLSGVAWGLWHAPIILLGYHYPDHPQLGVLVMVGFTVLLGWLRLASRSIWPGVIGHGAVNASASAVTLFARADACPDTMLVGTTGITGRILPVLVILALVVAGRLPGTRKPSGR